MRFTSVSSTISNSPKVPRAKFLGRDGLICSINIYKFDNLKNPFATITSMSDLYFRFRRFILLVQKKKEFYNFLQHKQLRWVRLDLIITMRDIYISSNMNPLLKFTNSTRIISTRIVISYGMKQDILFYVWWKVNGDWDKYMIRFSQWMESNYRTNISFRKNKSKGTRLCKSQSGIQVGKLAIWVRSFEIHKLFTEAPSLPEVRLTLLNTNPVFQCFEPSVSMPQGKKIISWKFIFKFCEVFHNICSFDFHLQSKFIVIINIILSSCNIIFLVVINNHLSRIY